MSTKTALGKPLEGIPLSAGIRAGDYVFLSGQIPLGADGRLVEGDIEAQTRAVMENIKATLAEAGCTMDDVVKCTCWLDDRADFPGFNKVYAEYFTRVPPARSTTQAKLMIDCKVEVEAIAHKPA